MRDQCNIELRRAERLVTILDQVPRNTSVSHLTYALVISRLRKRGGNRAATARELKIAVRTLRNHIDAMELAGFDAPRAWGKE